MSKNRIKIILNIAIAVLIIIDCCLVFLPISDKQFWILGIYAIAFILFVILKKPPKKTENESKRNTFKRKFSYLHFGFVFFVIVLMLFLMIKSGDGKRGSVRLLLSLGGILNFKRYEIAIPAMVHTLVQFILIGGLKDMSIRKKLKLLTICSAILSIVLYCVILFQRISIIEYSYAQIALFFAEALLILTVIFIVCTILISKNAVNPTKIKSVVIASTVAVIIGCISLCGYGYLTCYNSYTPEDILENDKTYIQSFFPYHNIVDDKQEPFDLAVSHIPGTDYISLYCYGTHLSGSSLDYEVEYFKSTSPFMNLKFNLERSVLTPLSEDELDVLVPGKEMEVDGVSLTVYVDENDYAVLIKSFNQSVYASVLNVSSDDISIEDFAREIINQFILLEKAVKDQVFLDVPLSEAF